MEKCFAMKVSGECAALSSDAVACTNCPFYKTTETAKAGQEMAFERMRGLSAERQMHIAVMYYGKRLPWAVAE